MGLRNVQETKPSRNVPTTTPRRTSARNSASPSPERLRRNARQAISAYSRATSSTPMSPKRNSTGTQTRSELISWTDETVGSCDGAVKPSPT